MKIVILCGGQGTRIRDVSEKLPKPMIPIGRFPILWHIMRNFSQWNHNEFVLCLGYKGNVIKDFFLNYDAYTQDFTLTTGNNKGIQFYNSETDSDWNITLADTGEKTLTGTRLKMVQKYVAGEENFFLTYGDGLADVNIDRLLEFHKSHGRIVTVTGVRPPGRFGELEYDGNGQVIEFNEKPHALGGRISGGFFVCRREIFDYLDESRNEMLEQDPLRNLARDGQLMVYRHKGFWQCMDTYRDYKLLSSLWGSGTAPWKIW